MLSLEIPYPPSTNRYYRNVQGRTLISREGRAFREQVCLQLASGGRKPPTQGRIALCMDAFPPDRRRRDLDNLQKPSLDAMQHAGVYQDDSQVDLLITRRCEPSDQPHIHVRIMLLPLLRCPICNSVLPSEN